MTIHFENGVGVFVPWRILKRNLAATALFPTFAPGGVLAAYPRGRGFTPWA